MRSHNLLFNCLSKKNWSKKFILAQFGQKNGGKKNLIESMLAGKIFCQK